MGVEGSRDLPGAASLGSVGANHLPGQPVHGRILGGLSLGYYENTRLWAEGACMPGKGHRGGLGMHRLGPPGAQGRLCGLKEEPAFGRKRGRVERGGLPGGWARPQKERTEGRGHPRTAKITAGSREVDLRGEAVEAGGRPVEGPWGGHRVPPGFSFPAAAIVGFLTHTFHQASPCLRSRRHQGQTPLGSLEGPEALSGLHQCVPRPPCNSPPRARVGRVCGDR